MFLKLAVGAMVLASLGLIFLLLARPKDDPFVGTWQLRCVSADGSQIAYAEYLVAKSDGALRRIDVSAILQMITSGRLPFRSTASEATWRRQGQFVSMQLDHH
jgi:hypothetical protein